MNAGVNAEVAFCLAGAYHMPPQATHDEMFVPSAASTSYNDFKHIAMEAMRLEAMVSMVPIHRSSVTEVLSKNLEAGRPQALLSSTVQLRPS